MTSGEFAYLQGLGYTGSLADKRNAYYTDLAAGAGQGIDGDLATGYKAQTVPRRSVLTAAVAPATDKLYLTAIQLYANQVISTLAYTSYSQALVTPAHVWTALYGPTAALNAPLIVQSPDQPALTWAAFNEKIFTLNTPYTVPAYGWYYTGIFISAVTPPNIAYNTSNVTIGQKIPCLGGACTNTGLTNLAPSTANMNPGQGNQLFYCAVA